VLLGFVYRADKHSHAYALKISKAAKNDEEKKFNSATVVTEAAILTKIGDGTSIR
jgi:hypothetical protein